MIKLDTNDKGFQAAKQHFHPVETKHEITLYYSKYGHILGNKYGNYFLLNYDELIMWDSANHNE